MRSILLTVALVLTSTVAAAQSTAGPGAKITWDHDRSNTTRFETLIDNGPAFTNINLPATNEWVLPALTAGNHTVQVRACNAVGCSSWSTPPLQIQVIVVPAVPSNLRLAPAVINSALRGVPSAVGASRFQ